MACQLEAVVEILFLSVLSLPNYRQTDSYLQQMKSTITSKQSQSPLDTSSPQAAQS